MWKIMNIIALFYMKRITITAYNTGPLQPGLCMLISDAKVYCYDIQIV